MVGLNEQFYAAADALNISTLDSLVDQMEAEEETYKNSRETILLPLQGIATEYALFTQKGDGYTAQLEALDEKK